MASEIAQGVEIEKGIIMDGFFFKNKNNLMLSPPIWVFISAMGDIKNHINHFKNKQLDNKEINHLINSTLDSLISDILIYLENRLKLMAVKNKFENVSFNSIPSVKKAYKKIIEIDLETLISKENYNFLKNLDIERGKKHHRNDRYSNECIIDGHDIKEIGNIFALVEQSEKIIQLIEQKFDEIIPIYNITKKKIKDGKKVILEWTSINHAFDLKKNEIVKKRKNVGAGVDETNIGYFAVEVNFK